MEQRKGFGISDSGFGRIASLASIVAFLGFASLSRVSGAELTSSINVRVYNYARVEQKTLVGTEKEATRILRQAGIETDWLDCPLNAAEFEKRPACQSPLGPGDLVLRVVPQSMADRMPLDHSKVGFAFVTKQGEQRGSLGGVFYDRIRAMARCEESAVEVALGRAMAHEIGHLLLRTDEHSKRGLMRGDWHRRDFCNGIAILLFNPQQAERMRAEVLARQEALRAQK